MSNASLQLCYFSKLGLLLKEEITPRLLIYLREVPYSVAAP